MADDREPANDDQSPLSSGDPLGAPAASDAPVDKSPTLPGPFGGGSAAPPGFAPPAAPPAPAPYGGGPVPPGAFPSAPMPAPGPAPMGQYQLAGWGKRALAAIVDGIIVTVMIFVVLAIFGAIFGGVGAIFGDGGGGAGIGIGVILGIIPVFVLSLVYQPYVMGKTNGQTLGKKMLGIRVVRTNGQATDFSWSAVRQIVVIGLLFGVVGSFLLYVPWLLNYLWPLWDEENRALHDMLVSSRVVEAS